MGTDIVNDDGAIIAIPLGTPIIKEYPITVMIITTILVGIVMMIPIVVTLVGIVIDISDVIQEKAQLPIDYVNYFDYDYYCDDDATTTTMMMMMMTVIMEMMIPIVMTLVGIVTDVSAVAWKEKSPNDSDSVHIINLMIGLGLMIPIVVTPVEIETDVRAEQPKKA